ncbi:LysR substrate-binding domain-containing protein [Aestuariispira insulae]|uniref:LysR family glycine cleavage system transcriptional activator n=1 Tax=Aestuariispira insulae TaxID=1461337 RepID=A0A3D9HT23_9PROT|nr:LysR substrate-binding domain-containing protein [Aestuariispira insulae]RED52026.1 LysR family glycine cleavage system transcriptional activator [Aestuariispira insulae]
MLESRNRHLPPLNSIRAFEACARLGSVSKASQELSVSPSAVSQQLKLLEDWLSVSLVLRQPNRIGLTEAGKRYLLELTDLLDQLDAATDRLMGDGIENRLRISVVSSFASEWLMPRLRSFRSAYPKVQLELLTSDHFAEFARDRIDMAIRYGGGDWPGVTAERLMPEWLGPVCHPEVVTAGVPVPMLVDSGSPTGMRVSEEKTILEQLDDLPLSGDSIGFSDAHLMFAAARQGEGVSLGRSALVAEDLAAGRLVPLVKPWKQSPYAYYLVFPERREPGPAARLFRRWMQKQAAVSLAGLPEWMTGTGQDN